MLFSIKKSEWLGNERNDLFAGLVSSVAILPEVIGFAIIAGVHPLSAVFASAVTLLVITFTGGRPAMVSDVCSVSGSAASNTIACTPVAKRVLTAMKQR